MDLKYPLYTTDHPYYPFWLLQAPSTCLLNDFIGNSHIGQCTTLGKNGYNVKTLLCINPITNCPSVNSSKVAHFLAVPMTQDSFGHLRCDVE